MEYSHFEYMPPENPRTADKIADAIERLCRASNTGIAAPAAAKLPADVAAEVLDSIPIWMATEILGWMEPWQSARILKHSSKLWSEIALEPLHSELQEKIKDAE
jgi:hypothetical protein